MNIEQAILNHLNKLPPDKQQEVLDFVEFLTTRIDHSQPPDDQKKPAPLSMGALAHLGVHITQEEIKEARREMWGNFPREVNL
ncbi:MAG: hypothetical protein BWK78_01575 [Thiotrichaceae bacterium IS1]|nr:MAG: hypothetical protein BWK78_01575 [Thiotrichaceae bacterium IS1]